MRGDTEEARADTQVKGSRSPLSLQTTLANATPLTNPTSTVWIHRKEVHLDRNNEPDMLWEFQNKGVSKDDDICINVFTSHRQYSIVESTH